ncbi:MAG: ABC transporter permease [Candidatus Merdivicinus sp.]|jgi:putative aldouronate transport system permease protein
MTQTTVVSSKRCREHGHLSWREDFHRHWFVYCMAIPVLVYYIVFHYVPMGGLVIAFQDFKIQKGFFASDWVGFKHFADFLTGPFAWRTIRNTLLINVYSILFGFPLPILFALMVNEVESKSFRKVTQTISYMPHFISTVVICGMLADFCRTTGLFNDVFGVFLSEPINFLNEPKFFRAIYVGSSIWQSMGWSSIIYLATLSSVDVSLYDAASIDGANRFQRIWHITVPCLVPIITIQLIMRIGNIMSLGFEKIILLYNPLTYETADTVSSYVYRYGLQGAHYSFGAAVGMFNSFVNIIILVTANKLSQKFLENSLW